MSLNNLHVVLLFHTGKGNYCITTKLGGSLLLLFLLWFLYHFELLHVVPNASFIGSKSPKRWFSRTHTHHLSPGLSSESPFCFVLICPLGPPRVQPRFFRRKNYCSFFQFLCVLAEIVIDLMARQTVVYSYACHSSFCECHLSFSQSLQSLASQNMKGYWHLSATQRGKQTQIIQDDWGNEHSQKARDAGKSGQKPSRIFLLSFII